VVVTILIGLLVIAYTAAVVSGRIPTEHKIDAVNLALIALALIGIGLLLSPQTFERLKHLKMAGFELEMLERVKEKQAKQEEQLKDIGLLLPLLLPEKERKHLVNLAEGRADQYKGNPSLRSELRRLRSLDLIKMCKNEKGEEQQVGYIKDGSVVNLAKYVQLTGLGEKWVKRIKEIEKTEIPDEV
jgi:hypothetical protein